MRCFCRTAQRTLAECGEYYFAVIRPKQRTFQGWTAVVTAGGDASERSDIRQELR